jgi:uncharacterized protein (TIGR02058 family)
MPKHRVLTEFGMGTSLRRRDYTQAAKRAVQDALWHNSINLAELFGFDKSAMQIDVAVAVQNPMALDCGALVTTLPRGQANMMAVKGGQNVTAPDTGETLVIATAAVEAFLPEQLGKWRQSG